MSIPNPEEILPPREEAAIAWCMFDPAWYLQAYPDVRGRIANDDFATVRQYYIDHGRTLGHAPNMFFDEGWYRARYPDIDEEIESGGHGSGYEHYCATGYLTRSAHWLYDEAIYTHYAPEVTFRALTESGCRNRYDYYLKSGARSGHLAHMLFDPATYRSALGAEAPPEGDSAFHHFLHRIWHEQRDATTSIFFDLRFYFDHNEQALEAIRQGFYRCALHHYLIAPGNAERDPLSRFSESFYREANPDVRAAIQAGRLISGYDHFLRAGVWDLRSPTPDIDLRAFSENNPRAAASVAEGRYRNIFEYLLRHDGARPAPSPAPADAPVAHPVARSGYDGVSTLRDLRDPVFLEVDETLFCAGDGVALIGWMLAPSGVIAGISLHSQAGTFPLDPASFLRLPRPDVADIGARYGLNDPNAGFITFVPGTFAPDDAIRIEIATTRGESGVHGVPPQRTRGIAAIRLLLDSFDLRHGEMVRAFDRIIGPAITGVNRDRLREPRVPTVISFGTAPGAPEVSLIIPLHGRLDFLEHQMAAFARHPPTVRCEYIYVLDDPPRRREAELLAASVFARFALPFRLAILPRNLGYAPANNIGLGLARAAHVCLMNSDVFPDGRDWLECLLSFLRNDSTLGAVGPMLLYWDGTVQHRGMTFEALPEFGNWMFPLHEGKGLQPPLARGLQPCAAITGGCLLIQRDMLRELGGLDESYILGDFEDADLCMKLAARGLGCAVDTETTLYHLERQSQASSAERWRMNLTLYNAWVHQRRWDARLGEPAAASPAQPQTPRKRAGRTKHAA
jgi:GT2 family glycosyltransferase